MAVSWFLLVAVATVLVPTASLAHGPSSQAASAEARAARAAARGAAEQLTVEMTKKNGHYHAAHAAGRAGLEADLVTMATNRRQALLSLIEDEPGAVLRLAMPAKVRASLPPAVRSLVEDDADEEGELKVLHEGHPVVILVNFQNSNYRRYVYAFPSNACGWWGLGTVGGHPSRA